VRREIKESVPNAAISALAGTSLTQLTDCVRTQTREHARK